MKTKFISLFFALTVTSILYGQTQKLDDESMALASFLSGKNFKSIQLEKYPTGHQYAMVKLNGVDARFILDTGAGATIVDTKLKDRFQLKTINSSLMGVGAGGGNLSVQATTGNTLEIGDAYENKNQPIMLMSLEHINGALRAMHLQEADGVLGVDVLKNGSALIDFKNMLLYLKK
ncbi:MAG: retropepsin-like aspartic protease [Verrucomicrobiota bacterium]